jgi:mycothiol synthase
MEANGTDGGPASAAGRDGAERKGSTGQAAADRNAPGHEVIVLDSLAPASALLAEATSADGLAPLSDGLLEAASDGEALLLGLVPHGSAGALSTGALAGVAVAALQGTRWAAEAVVAPARRGTGLGRQLLTALGESLRERGVEAWFWSHGDHPAAARLAADAGYTRARELLQLATEPLGSSDLPAPQVPEGVTLRSVRDGDAEDWARVNNAAFSWHPEQSDQPVEEYAARLRDPEFDRDSVVIAERGADHRLLGFHETKMHAAHPSGLRMGEVYVIGVDPQVHARGVGRALLLEGMRRLVGAGAEAVELYVESDNASALPLYRSTGFTRTLTHVSYAPPRAAGASQPSEA